MAAAVKKTVIQSANLQVTCKHHIFTFGNIKTACTQHEEGHDRRPTRLGEFKTNVDIVCLLTVPMCCTVV